MELKNWKIYKNYKGHVQAEGNVFGSEKFEDGTNIRTSKIQEIKTENDWIIVKALNSEYRMKFNKQIATQQFDLAQEKEYNSYGDSSCRYTSQGRKVLLSPCALTL